MPPAGQQLRLTALVYLALGIALLCNGSDGETRQKYANESLADADDPSPVWSQFLEDYVLRYGYRRLG